MESMGKRERQKTRKNGRYSDAPKCEICGKGIFDYYSHPDCNETAIGIVLCKKHADATIEEIRAASK